MKNGEWKMENGKETVADVVRQMREAARPRDIFRNGEQFGEPTVRGGRIFEWAERLEAAADDAEAAQLENGRLRSLVKRLADMVDSHEVWRPTGGELLLLAEAREATGEARR